MNSSFFSLREQEIFDTLKKLRHCHFVIIGGYAVNAYALPRFSVDCYIVIKDSEELRSIEKILLRIGYHKKVHPENVPYSGHFARFEKKIENNFSVSIDILVGTVVDRLSGASFSAQWVFEHSSFHHLVGKTITEELEVRIIGIDALLVMKIVSCRATDIRDVFMMFLNAKSRDWIRTEILRRCDAWERFGKLIEKVNSPQFKDGLAGVYGYFDEKVFEKHRKALLSLRED